MLKHRICFIQCWCTLLRGGSIPYAALMVHRCYKDFNLSALKVETWLVH